MPAKKKPQRNARKKLSFEKRIGMGRKEWAVFRKENPTEANELRQKAYKLLNNKR